jgi:signal transduction histidine kinase
MKTKIFPLFGRILLMVFALITILSLTFILIAYTSVVHYYQASTQLLNKDVAAHIAKFTSPFDQGVLNKQKADSVFYQAMVISPSVEVYFLDTTGRVIYFHGAPNEVRQPVISLESIREYLNGNGQMYIKGPDPRDPSDPKIFSAAAVQGKSGTIGYIYVILGSTEYRSVTHLIFKSHAGGLLIEIFLFILLATLVLTMLYVNRLERNFRKLILVLKKFESGDLTARFQENEKNELTPVTDAFNKMSGMLVENIEKLKRAEVERKDFTTNISHDLRTPLAIARGYAETVSLNLENNTAGQPENAGYTKLIISNIQTVEHMVQQLLDLSKMESAAMNLQIQPFVFSEIVQELVHSLSLTAHEKKIAIRCVDCENTSWIHADIHMMERVVQNLLTNALKFTPENGQILIQLKNLQNQLVFEISNQGSPMPENLFNWLNDHQSDASNTRPYNHGLGLVIVKTILQLHHFPIEAGFKEGIGNSIAFQMPVTNPASTVK